MDKYTGDTLLGNNTVHEVLESPEFKRLVARRWAVSGILLALLFASYYGYILVVAVNKPWLAQKVGTVTTLGIPIGVGVIVFAFILTAVYVVWANNKYDPEVQRIRDQLRKEE